VVAVSPSGEKGYRKYARCAHPSAKGASRWRQIIIYLPPVGYVPGEHVGSPLRPLRHIIIYPNYHNKSAFHRI